MELTVDPNNGNQLHFKNTSISLFRFGGVVTEKLHTSALKQTKKKRKKLKGKQERGQSFLEISASFVAIQSFNNGEKVSVMRSINQQGVPALCE